MPAPPPRSVDRMSETNETTGTGHRPRGRQHRQGEGNILVTQVRSEISSKPKHRGTLRALGLRRLGASNVLPDRPEIRGMIARVPHLVTVEPAPAGAAPGSAEGAAPGSAEGAAPAASGRARAATRNTSSKDSD